jgi:hypothetical protein
MIIPVDTKEGQLDFAEQTPHPPAQELLVRQKQSLILVKPIVLQLIVPVKKAKFRSN